MSPWTTAALVGAFALWLALSALEWREARRQRAADERAFDEAMRRLVGWRGRWAVKAEINGTGVAVCGPDTNHLELTTWCGGISQAVEAAGGEVIAWSHATAFEYEGVETPFGSWDEYRAEYRAETGRERPRVYRMRISVELDELPDDEAAAWWKAREREYVDPLEGGPDAAE